MYVKYLMTNDEDYRGAVKLTISTDTGDEIAYASVAIKDPDMIELIQDEIDLVKEKTNGKWPTVRDQYISAVDGLADEVRMSYLNVGSKSIDLEYTQVEMRLQEWIEAGSDINDVPDDLVVWAESEGQTVEWAIMDIQQKIYGFREALRLIRRVRLSGKASLISALDTDLDSVFSQTMDDLNALRNPETL